MIVVVQQSQAHARPTLFLNAKAAVFECGKAGAAELCGAKCQEYAREHIDRFTFPRWRTFVLCIVEGAAVSSTCMRWRP
jgi:hypothetical protein